MDARCVEKMAAATTISVISGAECGPTSYATIGIARRMQKKAAKAVQHHKCVQTSAENKKLRQELASVKALLAPIPPNASLDQRVEAQRTSMAVHANPREFMIIN